MMTSFIGKKEKKELEPSTTTRYLLDSRHFELIKFIQVLFKTRMNRDSRRRNSDLCIKRCLGSKKSVSHEISRTLLKIQWT